MTIQNEPRLLPWTGPEGKPCYLSTDENGGYLSRLADTTESVQLGLAAELLEHAAEVLADGEMEPNESRQMAVAMSRALRDTLRVAISRGHRLSQSRHIGS